MSLRGAGGRFVRPPRKDADNNPPLAERAVHGTRGGTRDLRQSSS